jgi:hypothetical protein
MKAGRETVAVGTSLAEREWRMPQPTPAAADPHYHVPQRPDGYARRRPEETVVHQTIAEHWPTFCERLASRAACRASSSASSKSRAQVACVARFAQTCYTASVAGRTSVRTRSFRIDPKLVAAARRATGAGDDTEAVRIALAELVERAQFQRWVRKVAGKGKLDGIDS